LHAGDGGCEKSDQTIVKNSLGTKDFNFKLMTTFTPEMYCYQNICCLPDASEKSQEELRFEDLFGEPSVGIGDTLGDEDKNLNNDLNKNNDNQTSEKSILFEEKEIDNKKSETSNESGIRKTSKESTIINLFEEKEMDKKSETLNESEIMKTSENSTVINLFEEKEMDKKK